jgi:hypothetical protein
LLRGNRNSEFIDHLGQTINFSETNQVKIARFNGANNITCQVVGRIAESGINFAPKWQVIEL